MRSRRLEDIFEECLTAVLEGRRSVEECRALYPDFADELQSLLDAVLDLRSAYAVRPSPDFAEAARRRFLEAARQSAVGRGRQRLTGPALPFWQWVPAIGAAVLFLALLGWVSATLLNEDSSLIEPVQVRLVSHIEEVKANLDLVEQAVQQGQAPQPTLIEDITVLTSEIEAILSEAGDQLPPDVVNQAQETVDAAGAVLETLGPTPTPTPTPTATPTPTPSPTPTPEASPTPTPTLTPEATPTPSPTPGASPTPTPTP